MPMKSAILNLVVLRARDLDRARTFYQTLGIEFVEHSHGQGPTHLAAETEGQVFEIYPLGHDDTPTSSTRIGFAVPSVDDLYPTLLAAGGRAVSLPKNSPWGRRAVIADPDDHHVELTETAQ